MQPHLRKTRIRQKIKTRAKVTQKKRTTTLISPKMLTLKPWILRLEWLTCRSSLESWRKERPPQNRFRKLKIESTLKH